MLVDDRPVLCFDIGGTSVKIGLFDVKKDHLDYLYEVLTSLFTDKKSFESFLIEECSSYDNLSAIAFASTGLITRDCKVASWGPLKFLEKLDFKVVSGDSQWPAVALNDVSAAAYGELASSGRAINNFLFISIGTWIGAGVVLDGKLIEGQHGFAGEFGKSLIYHPGYNFYSELEDFCGGKAIAKSLGLEVSKLRFQKPNKLWGVVVDDLSCLIFAIQNSLCLLDVSTIILGGGITELMFPFYKRELEKNLTDLNGKKIKVRKAKYGFKAGMVGIGYYAKHQLLTKEG